MSVIPLLRMAKVRIEFLAKDFTLDCDIIETESDLIPRAGEIIDAGAYVKKPGGASPYYMVLSVTYELTERGFLPHITGHSWDKDIRSELLRERGWLPPVDATNIVHDEDDSHLNDAPSNRRGIHSVEAMPLI